jgi:hypothetical protein
LEAEALGFCVLVAGAHLAAAAVLAVSLGHLAAAVSPLLAAGRAFLAAVSFGHVLPLTALSAVLAARRAFLAAVSFGGCVLCVLTATAGAVLATGGSVFATGGFGLVVSRFIGRAGGSSGLRPHAYREEKRYNKRLEFHD